MRKPGRWQWWRQLSAAFNQVSVKPAVQSEREVTRQRNIFLPTRLIVALIVFYQFFYSATPWMIDVVNTYDVVFETIQNLILAYTVSVLVIGTFLFVVRRLPAGFVQWLIFFLGLADGLFLGGLTVVTGGFESNLYWVYPALIIVNAASIPLATPQIVLNLTLGIFFLTAGLVERDAQRDLVLGTIPIRTQRMTASEIEDPFALAHWLETAPAPFRRLFWDNLAPDTRSNIINAPVNHLSVTELRALLTPEVRGLLPWRQHLSALIPPPPEPEPIGSHYVLQVTVLVLLTFCCYGVQVLAAGQRRAVDERNEFTARTEQLRSTGRLAAEVAHQIKNPLSVINNVTFSLQKHFAAHPPEALAQIAIIREEVGKADRIITQVMGYAQLTEGRVERLDLPHELHRVVAETFPVPAPSALQIQCDFHGPFPPLLMQRKHFADAVGNLLQNAREAVPAAGRVLVQARVLENSAIEISVQDNGPGVPPDQRGRIFEAYYTTKEHGSGLGLAITKRNVELYGGTVRVESELGTGAKFILTFPARTLLPSLS